MDELGMTFREFSNHNKSYAKAALRKGLWERAIKYNDFNAQKFLSKNHLGMLENPEPEAQEETEIEFNIGMTKGGKFRSVRPEKVTNEA